MLTPTGHMKMRTLDVSRGISEPPVLPQEGNAHQYRRLAYSYSWPLGAIHKIVEACGSLIAYLLVKCNHAGTVKCSSWLVASTSFGCNLGYLSQAIPVTACKQKRSSCE